MTSKKITMNIIVKEFGADILMTDNKILYCRLCNVKVTHVRRGNVSQHFATKMHKKAIELQVKPSSTFINTQEPILKNE